MKQTIALHVLGAFEAMTQLEYVKDMYSNVAITYVNADGTKVNDNKDIEIYNLDELKMIRKDLVVWLGNILGAFDAITKPLREKAPVDIDDLADVLSASTMAVYNSDYMKRDITKVTMQLAYEAWYREVRLYAYCLTTYNENKDLTKEERDKYLSQATNILEALTRQMIIFAVTQFYSSLKSDNPDYTRRHLDRFTTIVIDKFLFDRDKFRREV